jgi:NAD+ synthase (glutamine-hydrolysing)
MKSSPSLLVNLSASPYQMEKERHRHRLLSDISKKHSIPVAFVNQVGANDELIFDGGSMFIDSKGRVAAFLNQFRESVVSVDSSIKGDKGLFNPPNRLDNLFAALVLGISDYASKTGFDKIVLGLSGGIDSAVCACLSAAAVGADNLLCINMPGPYSSRESTIDSEKLATNIGCHFTVISINDIFIEYFNELENIFSGMKEDVTEENLQARIRGNIVMALSNKYGYLPISTGNKSEHAVGYCTLYGDMCGAIAPLSDVSKTSIYDLAKRINRVDELIPKSIIDKPPSAELAPNQRDIDSLPPYKILDKILSLYLDEGLSASEITKRRLPRKDVDFVISATRKSEFKRRQAPPGFKVSPNAFGFGRRMPIAAKW